MVSGTSQELRVLIKQHAASARLALLGLPSCWRPPVCQAPGTQVTLRVQLLDRLQEDRKGQDRSKYSTWTLYQQLLFKTDFFQSSPGLHRNCPETKKHFHVLPPASYSYSEQLACCRASASADESILTRDELKSVVHIKIHCWQCMSEGL